MRRKILMVSVAAVIVVVGLGYREATRDAVQRNFVRHMARWPQGEPPVRLVLISDLHVAEPDMSPARLAGIVARINALQPDCVLIAGDLVSDRMLSTRHVPFDEALAPLSGMRPRIATLAVLGNHDHWRNGPDAAKALRANGVRVLSNEAARCGALAIGGVDDEFTGHDRVGATEAAMRVVGGVPVLLSHSPDVFPRATSAQLMLAGHTHCRQIVLPFYGAVAIPSRYGRRFACGVIRENGRTMIVTAGLGTSVVPLRWGAPSDFWLVTVGR